MKGLDISHWQNDAGPMNLKLAALQYRFCFVKCSEGTGFLDPKYQQNKQRVREAGMLFGAYHFAKAGDPVKEADWFLKNVGDLQAGEIVILDYETYALTNPADWCLKWLKRVEDKLGWKPLLYTYHGLLVRYNWKPVSEAGFGLWAARYGLQEQEPNPKYRPSTGSWPFYAVWQYCSKGRVPGITGNCDLNVTDMDIDRLKKYGKGGGTVEPQCSMCCQKHCPR